MTPAGVYIQDFTFLYREGFKLLYTESDLFFLQIELYCVSYNWVFKDSGVQMMPGYPSQQVELKPGYRN